MCYIYWSVLIEIIQGTRCSCSGRENPTLNYETEISKTWYIVCYAKLQLIKLTMLLWSYILSVEVNNLFQIKLEQRRTIIVHEPQHVLEQNGIHIDKDHLTRLMEIIMMMILVVVLLILLQLLPHGRVHQNPKRVLL